MVKLLGVPGCRLNLKLSLVFGGRWLALKVTLTPYRFAKKVNLA